MKPAGSKEEEKFSKHASHALEKMMAEYGTTVLRTAYFYTGDRYLAEDITQEVFIRAYRNGPSFAGKAK